MTYLLTDLLPTTIKVVITGLSNRIVSWPCHLTSQLVHCRWNVDCNQPVLQNLRKILSSTLWTLHTSKQRLHVTSLMSGCSVIRDVMHAVTDSDTVLVTSSLVHHVTTNHLRNVFIMHITAFRAGSSLSKPSPQYPVRPAENISFPTSFPATLFNSKSIELLTGSGSVAIILKQKMVISLGAVQAKFVLTAPPCLKFTSMGPSPSWAHYPAWGPFDFCEALYTFYTYTTIWGCFTSVTPPRRSEGSGVVCAGSQCFRGFDRYIKNPDETLMCMGE